jgi:hypothetical protein
MITTAVNNRDLVISSAEYRDEICALTPSGVAGHVTDTTTYPVVAQATKTEKVTVDGGAEQTVTFTTAISRGSAVTTNEWPVGSQDTKTEKVTVDGGAEQTVTFSGALTTAAHIAAAMDAQLTGCSVVVEGTAVRIYSDSIGPSSAIAIGTGTTDITWDTPAAVNKAADIAAQMNDQLDGCSVGVVAGQVKITSDLASLSSSVVIGTGTTALTWAADVDGTGVSGTVLKGTVMARNSSTGKMTVYSSGGSNSENIPCAVMPEEVTWADSTDKSLRILFQGTVLEANLCVHDVAGAVPTAAIQLLIANSGIIPVASTKVGLA